MKIIISISMSFLFLFQGVAANMEVCEQIEQLSYFVSHYQEHKEVDGDSFLEYVYEDFISDPGKTKGHHQDSDHEKEPLHTSHQCCQHSVFFTDFQQPLINDVPYEAQKHFNHYISQLNSRYLESLFQPPRV